jgi:hypothetical protein
LTWPHLIRGPPGRRNAEQGDALISTSRRICRPLLLMAALVLATVTPALAYLTDAGIHPPPTTGSYAYYASFGNFGPDRSGFPAKGQSFVDPVFGSTIVRLTSAIGPAGSDIYAKNGFWNADGTRILNNTQATRMIIDSTTGAVIRSDVPGNFDGSFAPNDPDIWYWFNGASLMKYSIASGTSSVVKAFSGSLDALGGSVDFIDNSGRYMVLNIGGSVRVWDSQSDVLYAGAISSSVGSGWIGITPDAKYVVTAGDPTVHMSYAIDHSTRTVNTSGVSFWTLCGDHGDLMAASNGKTYFVTHECYTDPGIYAVDVSIPQSASDPAKQRADATKLIALPWADNDGHISAVSRGALQDWAFVSIESSDDTFTSGVSGWRSYEQEIVMANVITGEVRRLAHHRSRGLDGSYYYQPRVNASWDGTRVAWSSNFGLNSPDYSDIYSIVVATGSTPPPPTALTVGFTNPASGATVSGTTTVSMTASGGSGYTYTLKLDSAVIYSGTNATFSWNTTAAVNGAHTLTATVTDSSSNSGAATRSVTVSNTTATVLTASFTAPAAAATVKAVTMVNMSASGSTATSRTFSLKVDAVLVSTQTVTGTTASFAWHTGSVSNGSHTLALTVRDSAGVLGTATRAVTVYNLKAVFTSPTAQASVLGTTTVGMSVSGSTATSRTFALKVDGGGVWSQTLSGSTTTFNWPTTSVANGSHTLALTVTDTVGGSATTSLPVTVSNTSSTSLTPAFTAPAAGATVTAIATVSMSVTGSTATSRTFSLKVDKALVSTQTVTGTTASFAWHTGSVGDGSHTLTLTVTDSAGLMGTMTRTVTVANTTASATPTAEAAVTGTMLAAVSGARSPETSVWSVRGVDTALASLETMVAPAPRSWTVIASRGHRPTTT